MPYAAEGRVTKTFIPDGIEITERQYKEAIHGMMSGKIVTVDGGVMALIDPPKPETPEPSPQDDYVPEQPPIPENVYEPPSIDAERNRRIERGFKFEGSLYPATPEDYSRIASWVSQATAALAMGVQAGNLRWHDGPDDFTWTDMHGIPTPLDAQQMIALGRAANAHRMRLDRKADALKADPPDDITDDEHWT